MARIDDFRSQLSGGGARPSHFRVILTFPDFSVPGNSAQQGVFLVKAAALPASTITPIEVPFRGRVTKVAGERQFANWTVTVLNDNDFGIRNALERWSQGILAHSETSGRLATATYQRNLVVQQLDRNDGILKEYMMVNCHPQNISEIGLDFGNTNSIEEYQVEFSVDYWVSSGVN